MPPTNEYFKMPIKRIGEENWVENLSSFLKDYDVDVSSIEDVNSIEDAQHYLSWTIPLQAKEYLLDFGGIKSSDFMYGLYEINKWIPLTNSEWAFISMYFDKAETDDYIVFADSPGTDPICFNKNTGEIYLFSHDPVKKGKVYKDFNDFLLNEIIEIQKLLDGVEFDTSEEEIEYKARILDGNGIDFDFRYMHL